MTRIGVDLDGVTYDYVSALRNRFASYGKPVDSMPDPHCWNIWECWGMEKDDWVKAADRAAVEGVFHQGTACDGAIEALCKLKKVGHTIHIVTHRELPHAQTSTIGWLNSQGIPYDTLTFSKEKTGFPVDVFIEDNIDNARAVEASGVPCFLLTRPWNKDAEDCRRVDTWEDFIAIIERGGPIPAIPTSLLDAHARGVFQGLKAMSDTPEAIAEKIAEVHRQIASANGERRAVSPTGGEKGVKDEQYSLIPVEPLAEVARVYGIGAQKYDRENWRRGYDWHLSYDALQRHVNAFWRGETFDPDDGLHHLAHAVFHCFALIAFGGDLERYDRFDDRAR